MIAFLTSDPMQKDCTKLCEENSFTSMLCAASKPAMHGIFICADPVLHTQNDFYAHSLFTACERAGLSFSEKLVLDGRNECDAESLVKSADFLILGGGHVPTQHAFFTKIGLRRLLSFFDGVILGISAGSMNASDVVYAQPELDGEAVDPDYRRFLPGLGIAETKLIPHFQSLRNLSLDGMRLIDDITLFDSIRRSFLAINDGSFLLCEDDREILFGEGYLIEDEVIQPCCHLGQCFRLY